MDLQAGSEQCALFAETGVSGFVPDGQGDHAAQQQQAGKKLVGKLYKLRQNLTEDEKAFLPQINACIDEIRRLYGFSASQREERILYAVEKQQAWTFTEIVEEVRFDAETVKHLVNSLIEKGILYKALRYIPGCQKPNYLIKSRRIDNVEVTETVFSSRREKSWDYD